jgi:hypothetical protein
MTKAGMWQIDVGIESGSDRIKRHVFNRPANNEAVMQAVKTVSRHPQVVAYFFFIIGNPYETRQDLLATIDLLQEMPPTFFMRAYSLVFIPGTQLFERACRDGIIAGFRESGFEIDFLGGLDPKGPRWKRKNLYLNSLVALMAGRVSGSWMGFLPRFIVPALTAPGVVDFCDRYIGIGRAIANLRLIGTKLRRAGLPVDSKVHRDNKSAYGVRTQRKQGGETG